MEYGTRSRATVDALIDLEEAEAETIASLEQRQANVANRHWRSVMSKLTATSNDVVKRAPTATARQSMAFRMLGSMNKASTYNSSDNLDALYQDVLESENKESEQEKVTDNDSKTEPNERVPLFQKSDSGVRKSFLSEEIASRKRRLFLQNVDPLQVLRCSFVAIWNSSIVRIGIPLYLAGLVLYFGNIDFNPFILPGSAPCSWWMIFLFHQTILFELSQLTQWIICVALGWAFRVSMEAKGDEVSLIPPVLVIAGFQSKGWPLITTFWSLWNMVFVMVYINCSGNRHVWTGLEIYGSGVNSGDQIITSEKYHQVLLSMLVVGVGKTFERTFLQLSVGKRNIAIFKPRLKKLLKDVALLTDIGILAEEIQAREDNKRASSLPSELAEMTSVFSKQVDGSERNDEDDTETMEPIDVTAPNPVGGPDIMDNLDPWEVPMKRVKMSSTITTHDILLFRRSLTYLNTTDPFGKPFGPAGDRKECVNSAQTVFQRLKKITPEAKSLPFDTIAVVVSQNESEELRKSQRKGLERIFNPNEENQLSLGDFLQGCDTVYKQLLYFRASIDSRLEMEKSIGTLLDWAFCFLMTLIVLSILEIDPMHFVVPATSVLVSISFAIGPSAGKILEGMLFVMLKRPYDLGDRIMIVGAQSYTSAELSQSWLVEGELPGFKLFIPKPF